MLNLGKSLILIGLIATAAGVFLVVGTKIPGLNRLGQLPGDLRVEGKNYQIYFPWVTCLVLSLLFSVFLWIFRGNPR